MAQYAALDVSQETTAICLVDEQGVVRREAQVMTCPEAIVQWLARNAIGLVRVGLETGPLAVWLWNELHAKSLPVVCMDARHANARAQNAGEQDGPERRGRVGPDRSHGLVQAGPH